MGRVVRKGRAMDAAPKEVCWQVTRKKPRRPFTDSQLPSHWHLWLFLGPQFTKHTPHTCHTHPLHSTQDQQETHNKHLYLHTTSTHYTKAKSSNYQLFATITYMQIQSLGEDIRQSVKVCTFLKNFSKELWGKLDLEKLCHFTFYKCFHVWTYCFITETF